MRKFLCMLFAISIAMSCSETEVDSAKEVTKIVLNESRFSLNVEESRTIEASVLPADATSVELTWSSSDSEVATVSEGTITAIAVGEATITVSAANGVKAECQVIVNAIDDGKTVLDFTPYAYNINLEKFENDIFYWNVEAIDKLAFDNPNYYGGGYSKGSALNIVVMGDSKATYGNGIPTGTLELLSGDAADKANAVRVSYYTYDTSIKSVFTGGNITIEMVQGGDFTLSTNINNANYKFENTYSVNTSSSDMFTTKNSAYTSTLSENLTAATFTKAVVHKSGAGTYDIYLGTDGIEIDPTGFFTGTGQIVQLWSYASETATSPNGDYTVGSDSTPYELTAGVLSPYGDNMEGSWWLDIKPSDDGGFTTVRRAPINAGNAKITLDEETWQLKITTTDFADDAKPSANTLSIAFDGKCTYFNPDDTGDFSNAAAGFYGPFQYESQNQNWNLQLEKTDGADLKNGVTLMFDMLATPNSNFADGLPLGTFTIDPSETPSLAEMTIPAGQVWTWVEGETNPEENIRISSGTVVVSNMDDGTGRTKIVVNATDTKGTNYIGTYHGTFMPGNQAYVPLSNKVFNKDGAEVRFTYIGEDALNNRSNWAIEMLESTAKVNSFPTGLILSLNLFTAPGHGFDKGMPVGKHTLYTPKIDENTGVEIEAEGKYGVSNDNYTFYHSLYQGGGLERKIGWTRGSVEVAKNAGDDNYSITLDFYSEAESTDGTFVSYSITGDYSGAVNSSSINSFSMNRPSSSGAKATRSNTYSKFN